MAPEIKKITLFKIKPSLDFTDYLKGNLDNYDKVGGGEKHFEGYIKYVNAGGSEKTEDEIPWLRFLNSGFEASKYEFKARNHYPRALMALRFKVDEEFRHYVAAFGQHGDSFLDKSRIVHDFGIRVGMNICDTGRLRRIQTSVHEAVSQQTERQASTGTNFRAFGINTEAEFLRTVSGYVKTEYQDIVESFRGRDSISIKFPRGKSIKWSDLVTICEKLDERYYATTYRDTEFRTYDILRHENDPEITSQLDQKLCQKIEDKDFSKIHLAPPEFVESESLDFAYTETGEDGRPPLFEDLRIEDLIARPGRRLKGLTQQRLKGWIIYEYNTEQEKAFPRWNAYECLVAEVELGGTTYVLSGGQWREISQELKHKVTTYFEDRDITLDAPYLPANLNIFDPVRDQNREEVYNRQAAKVDPNLFLFDKGKVSIADQGLYEICDLFHSDRHFIHVKRYSSGASSISHIFTQTKLYSHALATDESTRKSFCDWIDASAEPENVNKNREMFKALVPLKSSDVDERAYTVVFCLLHEKEDFSISDLPFMSQYELMLTHRFLTEDRRFKVAVLFRKIELGNKEQPNDQNPPLAA